MKITRPTAGQGSGSPARQYAGYDNDPIPKSAWSYIHLICGHLSYPEEQQRYRLWRPKRNLYWCEQCEDWVKLEPPYKSPVIPEVPLF